VKLTIMYDLCVRPGIDIGPKAAGAIADLALTKALESMEQARQRPDRIRQNVNIIVGWAEDG
jgi:hypothetical protein